jgi:hypothetical protein
MNPGPTAFARMLLVAYSSTSITVPIEAGLHSIAVGGGLSRMVRRAL